MSRPAFDLPNIHESLKRDYLSGKFSLEEVANEYRRSGHYPYSMTLRKAAELMGLPLIEPPIKQWGDTSSDKGNKVHIPGIPQITHGYSE